ncbi:MAG: alanine racemase [Caldilineaceae bacterium]|nr:alanine racemase [Caldilineaceae bacterium]
MTEIGLRKIDLDTPILWTDLDQLEQNIASMAQHCKEAGIHWRPHTKGIKTPAIVHKLLAAGALGITCAKLGEAEVMAAAGVTDILIANQVVGAQKITRLANLRRHADVKVAVDNADVVAAMGAAARAKGVELGVVVEVNTGMERAGVLPGAPTVALARLAHETPGVRLRGLMTWEGHTLASVDPDEKQRGIHKSIRMLLESVEACRRAGLPVEIVSCGGSGTYMITTTIPGITEIQAGGAIFGDMAYQAWGAPTTPALFVQSMVTSRPTPQRIIIDAGFKTLPRGFATPKPLGLAGVKSIAFSAEHGIITLEEQNDALKVGDRLDIIVGYSDATVCLHEQIYGIRRGCVETVWPVLARGKLQ